MTATTLKNLLAENNSYGIRKIIIPRIQRAYAQGRSDIRTVKTRKRFLDAIFAGLTGNGLTLDFIYGNITNGELIPLDGQQRLTTLWLLHWYAQKKEEINDGTLARFSYNTRYSARDFISRLVAFQPSWKCQLSEEIKNQGWFPMDWLYDPTVSGMLTMLDEINERFFELDDLWFRLDKINFYFRDIEEMRLTDDIYIKMNSRGKQLTDFEHFKAEFLKVIRTDNNNEADSKRIGLKLDCEWTDLIWPYRDSSNLVDYGFLYFFRIISLILIYKEDFSASEFNLEDDFDLLDRLYKSKPENVLFFEHALDCLVDIKDRLSSEYSTSNDISEDYFGSFLTIGQYQPNKVVVPSQIDDVNILKVILNGSSGLGVSPKRKSLYLMVIFYSFLLYLMNHVEEDVFRRRLRIVVNLIKNSGNEVVDNPKGDAGNRMPAILKQVENIILYGVIADRIEINGEQRQNFNVIQMEEERKKLVFTTEHPEFADNLFQLEDYYLIGGRTDVIGFENTHLYQRFIQLFDCCTRDYIDCAMLAIKDYSQRLNNWCVQLGSSSTEDMGNKAWYALFHPTGKNLDFNNTKYALRTLLERCAQPNDDFLKQVADTYLEQCKIDNIYDWRYYYIAYPCFRSGRYGKYTMYVGQPYAMVALYAEKRESSNAYQCMLQCLIDNQAVASSSEWLFIRGLSYKKGWLTCENDAFVSYSIDDRERGRFNIPQSEDGVDMADRIQYFKEYRKDDSHWIVPSNQHIDS